MSAVNLPVVAAKAAIERAGIEGHDVSHPVFGSIIQSTTDTVYFARHVGLKAGFPFEVTGLTVNRLCGSGLHAIISGAHEIMAGDADVCLVGGGESMSTVPHAARGLRWGLPYGAAPMLEDLLFDGLADSYCQTPMGITAENLESYAGAGGELGSQWRGATYSWHRTGAGGTCHNGEDEPDTRYDGPDRSGGSVYRVGFGRAEQARHSVRDVKPARRGNCNRSSCWRHRRAHRRASHSPPASAGQEGRPRLGVHWRRPGYCGGAGIAGMIAA